MNIAISGLFQVKQSGNTGVIDDLAVAIPNSSSNVSNNTTTVLTGSWQQLPTSSLANVRYMNFDSLSSQGTIQLATGSAGGNILAILQAGDVAVIPWSGSLNALYAQTVSGSLSASLNSAVL